MQISYLKQSYKDLALQYAKEHEHVLDFDWEDTFEGQDFWFNVWNGQNPPIPERVYAESEFVTPNVK